MRGTEIGHKVNVTCLLAEANAKDVRSSRVFLVYSKLKVNSILIFSFLFLE